MTDTKLRCVIIYRLEDPPVAIAKYDHVSQYETHDRTVLYGGREQNYADAVAKIIGSDPPGGLLESEKLGGFKIVQSDAHQVVYGSDADGICVAVITGLGYPSRAAFAMLNETYNEFAAKHGADAITAKENALSRKAKPILASACTRYEDSAKIDKAQVVLAKVNGIKEEMQENIVNIYKNTEKAEVLADMSSQMQEQAADFKRNSKDLKRQMRCKNIRMTLLLTFLLVLILIAILVPFVKHIKNK